jgi:hypothetical protein
VAPCAAQGLRCRRAAPPYDTRTVMLSPEQQNERCGGGRFHASAALHHTGSSK